MRATLSILIGAVLLTILIVYGIWFFLAAWGGLILGAVFARLLDD